MQNTGSMPHVKGAAPRWRRSRPCTPRGSRDTRQYIQPTHIIRGMPRVTERGTCQFFACLLEKTLLPPSLCNSIGPHHFVRTQRFKGHQRTTEEGACASQSAHAISAERILKPHANNRYATMVGDVGRYNSSICPMRAPCYPFYVRENSHTRG